MHPQHLTEYRQRLALEELVTEAYLSSSKPAITLPTDEEEVEMKFSPVDDEVSDELNPEVSVEPEISPAPFMLALPEVKCDEHAQAKKSFMIICDNIYKLKELAEGPNFLDTFEPWMLEKLAIVADTLTTVTNSAKFNSLD